MWYVVQTAPMQEEKVRELCRRQISSEVLERCVLPLYEEKIRYGGRWHTRQKKLFPGYLFLISDQVEALRQELKGIGGVTRILKTGDTVTPLTEAEVHLIQRLSGKNEVVELSEGIIENGAVRITSGPLKGLESTIQRIDRHKRKAWLNMEMFGRMQLVEVGVEILEKR